MTRKARTPARVVKTKKPARRIVPPAPRRKAKPKKKGKKMSEGKPAEKHSEKDPKEPKAHVYTGDEGSIAIKRSDTEQSIIDTYGDDPSKYKEGTRERELVDSLPENIAKKQAEEAKKKEEKK